MKLFIVICALLVHSTIDGAPNRLFKRLQGRAKCGAVANQNMTDIADVAEYKKMGTVWKKTDLTWKFNDQRANPGVDKSKVRFVAQKAFSAWSKPSNLNFREVLDDNDADIVISFEKQIHFDIDNVKMEHSVLAHAFSPAAGIGGDVHIRNDIQWDFDVLYTQEPAEGYSFYAVLLHELGHSFGLDHSEHETATMSAYYNSYQGVLSNDDINGIQSLYGKPSQEETDTASTALPKICSRKLLSRFNPRCQPKK